MSKYHGNIIITRQLACARLCLVFLAAFLVTSCGLVDLRPVQVVTNPHDPGAILPSRLNNLSITFSAEPDRARAERAVSVRSAMGTVAGDFQWNGNVLFWKPLRPWEVGVRYRLLVKGAISMADGREARPEIDIPFFAEQAGQRPVVEYFEPASGASVGAAAKGQCILRLLFSEAMDRRTVEDALSFRPSVACGFDWTMENRELRVLSSENLEPCSSYRWTLGTGALSDAGSPLVRSESGVIRSDLDTSAPRVERVYPVMLSGGVWVELGDDLDQIEGDQSVALYFSEPVKAESVKTGIRVTPGVSGRVDLSSPHIAVYTPDRPWPPEQTLTLVVSQDIRDEAGLKTGAEFRKLFTPRNEYLELHAVFAGADEALDRPKARDTLAVNVGALPDGLLSLTFRFSDAFSPPARIAATERIALSAFFPGTLASPRLRDVAWVSDDTLVMSWEGLRPSTGSGANYYRLLIPGGQGGVTATTCLREDYVIFLEAKR